MAMATAALAAGSSLSATTASLPRRSGVQAKLSTPPPSIAPASSSSPLPFSPLSPLILSKEVACGGSALAGAFFAALASAESASAAQQVLDIAAAAADPSSDNRGLALLIPVVPAIGWVLYNILQPALNQINRMRSAKGLVIGLTLTAAAFSVSPHAIAAQETAQNDSRGLLILGILIPAVSWVLFNILRPGLNQIERMRASKAVVGAAGLSLLLPFNADAVSQDIAQIAAASEDNDPRGLLLLGVLIPAVGWVLFNILQPALNQINKMKSQK